MNRIAVASLVSASLFAAPPALALTNDHGVVVFTQADALAGNVTPGDTPGFPVTISVGGSYRLGSNLVVTTAVNGIEIRANEVSIDMAGFTLAGSGAGRNGIASFNRSLRVAGGNVRGFTNDGIRSIAQYLSVTDMLVTGNGRHGIAADSQEGSYDTAAFANITRSKSTANGSTGILCGSYCQVENSMASKNRYYGIILLQPLPGRKQHGFWKPEWDLVLSERGIGPGKHGDCERPVWDHVFRSGRRGKQHRPGQRLRTN